MPRMTQPTPAREATRPGFFQRLKQKLNRGLGLGVALDWLAGRKLDPAVLAELEDQLLLADVGIETSERIIEGLRKRIGRDAIVDVAGARTALAATLEEILRPRAQPLAIPRGGKPFLILMIGVNGSGKTTTIGKLARRYRDEGLRVMLAAGDTYRAAAIEQLQAWGERNGVPVVAQQPGADSAAVVFDALQAATARGIDVVLADTAGRLQNQAGLMQELAKVVRVAGRVDPAAPHEKMLVLDASLGQNAINQALQFHQAVGLTGISMTKLDGGGKGGVLLTLADRLEVPFRYVGVGEDAADLDVFDAAQFAAALAGTAP
ncbi:Signal recognition particle receptor FtsY [Gammaproteobacteria bacterium]|nr:signal recognition particle-docking protein FtsY [Gammaproteobacteria bacterium]CAG0943792.1 Signal recognition particle receptor FtsY [Gammaproteobacteria bacterium]